MKLVIVESPAKSKTISKFLGPDYQVEASYGHIRDLPGSAEEIPAAYKEKSWARLGVDVDDGYTPIYIDSKDSKKQISVLKKLLKGADEVVLATDEDREGEAISWHLHKSLNPKVPVKRIAFHEITKSAIQEAIANPREINSDLVSAQETRRILDRLFGYELSPVLWKRGTGRSAGRVQSPALRLVVEREEERRAFRKAEYWDIEAALAADGIEFTAALVSVGGQRIASGKDFDPDTGKLKSDKVQLLGGERANKIGAALDTAVWDIVSVEQKDAKLRPQPPFITSTLQQAASSLLGFSPKQTMRTAQRLYEGIDMGGGDREGLITYMRTDSVVLSEKALREAEDVIKKAHGDNYHHRRQFTTKSKMAQEAHEAIRPTHLDLNPEKVKAWLDADQLRLYRLIWNRMIASQMADAQLLKTTVDFEAEVDGEKVTLRSNGSVVKFPGFLKVADSGQKDSELPALKQGDRAAKQNERVAIEKVDAQQHETKPPARFTEAALVKRLEEEGIGRPSTYASILGVIQDRAYVEKIGKALAPTYLGIAVIQLLRKHFADYVDLKFTARMEDALDEIAAGPRKMVEFLDAFYKGGGDFGDGLKKIIERESDDIDYPRIPVGEDKDGVPIVVRLGKNAPYLCRGEGGTGNTAPVQNELTYDELTVEKAEELIAAKAKGNEPIGVDPETGKNVYVLLGPYGPYAQLGEQEEGSKKKPKRGSLPKGTQLEDVTLAQALKQLSLPRKLGEHPETGKSVRAAIGRFGPYIVTEGAEGKLDYRSIKGDDDVFTIELPRALELLAQPKTRGRGKTLLRKLGEHPESKLALEIYDGRYGPYVSDGTLNASLPKGADPEKFTVEEALPLLVAAAERGPKKKRPAKKKAAAKKKTAAKKKPAAKKKAAAKKKPAAKKKAAE